MLKARLIFILIGAIVILSLLFINQYNRTQKFKEQAEDRESIMNVKEKEWRTKEGRLVHQNSVIQLQSDKVTKEIFKQDSLLQEMNIKWNKVHSLSKTTVVNNYHITTPAINQGDSTYKIKEWTNGYLTTSGRIDLKKNIVSLDYQHKDTIFQVIHYKRSKKFLGIPYGKFNFVTETTTADTSSRIVDQITYIKQK
jgi:hypothetical protein